MLISGIKTRPSHVCSKARQKEGGFSLLEILIVLTILGLVVSLAAPRLTVYAQALQFSKKSQGVIYSLKRHRAEAVVNKRARWVMLGENTAQRTVQTDIDIVPIGLPDGWTAEGEPLFISAAGHCRGSRQIIISDPISQRQAVYEVLSPDCTAREIKAPIEPAEGDADVTAAEPNRAAL